MEGLHCATHGFLARLRVANERGYGIVSDDDLSVMFHNLLDLFTLSRTIVTDLEELETEGVLMTQAPNTLLYYAEKLRGFESYLGNYDVAVARLSKLRTENEEFEKFLEWSEQCEGVSLASCLILPVQRLPRYTLLLKELIKQASKRPLD